MTLTMSKTSMVAVRGEPDLVEATRAGDDRAFEELYARYRERIFAFILSRVRDHGRAEDIAQEVFISALRRLRASDQTIAFKPWIYEIAKNACIDEFRRGSRAREVPLETDGELTSERPTTLSALPTPLTAIESKQRISDLQGAFGGLSESHHQLLILREFEGLSYDEIGERLDMTRQMVESGLFRARRKLTEEYQELASGRRCEQVQLAIDTGVMSSARALGVRERRRFQRHLAHCQACRHVALQAGVDEALVRPRRVAAKIAGLLPVPFWRRLIRLVGAGGSRGGSGGSHPTAAMSLKTAAGVTEPAASSALSLGPAAVTAAALAIIGAGGVLVHGAGASRHAGHPLVAHPAASTAPAAVSGHATTGSAATRKAASMRRSGAALTGTGGSTGQSGRGAPARRGHAPRGGGGTGPGSTSSSSRPRATPLHAATSAVGAATSPLVAGARHTLSSTLTSATQGLTSTVHNVASGTQQAVSGVTKTVSTTAGTVGSTATKTLQTAGKTATGSVQAVGGVASGLSSSSPAPSSSSAGSSPATSTSPSSATGAVTQPVNNAAQSLASAAGQAVGGLTK